MWIVLLVAIHMATGESIVLAQVDEGLNKETCEAVAKDAARGVDSLPGYVVIGVCRVEV